VAALAAAAAAAAAAAVLGLGAATRALSWCSSEFLVIRNQQQESNESDLVCVPGK
jgi:hypothetical protein